MTLQTGVVGAGVVASNNHFPALSMNPRTDLTAVCDVDHERAVDATDEYGGRAYSDVTSMLDRESLDWLHVATPVQTHFDIASQALGADVPVLLQKPATSTSSELRRLVTLAADRDVPLSVVHNWLYYPAVRELRSRIADGAIGPVRAVQTSVGGEGPPDETYRGDWVFDLPGGAFEEGLPHPLYLTLALGGYPSSESAIDVQTHRTDTYDREIAYDGMQIQYVSDIDALCSITTLTDSARGPHVRVLGADGTLTLDLASMTIHETDDEAGPYHFWEERFRRNVDRTLDSVVGTFRNVRKYVLEYLEDERERYLPDSPDGHYYLIDRAAQALEVGRQPPRDPEESYWTLVLLEQVRAAADEQQRLAQPSRL